MDVQIHPSWKQVLKQEFTKPYFLQLVTFIKTERAQGKTIFPPGSLIFNAFNSTPFKEVKVVILGQDPYHGAGQAQGLSFSVPRGIPPPPLWVIFLKSYDPIWELKCLRGMAILPIGQNKGYSYSMPSLP